MSSQVEEQIPSIISKYGLSIRDYAISRVGSGYIHYTFKLSGNKNYILQRVNNNVFRQPELIAANLRHAANYLNKNHPDYLFLSPIETIDGTEMTYDTEGFPWRLFPFFNNTFTVDKVSSEEEAFQAAAEFARLTRNLDGVDVNLFKPTIDRFHDLGLRYQQFEDSVKNAKADRLERAADAIQKTKYFSFLVKEYTVLISSGNLKLRVTHNDTKINNVLFNSSTQKAVCAIDLDTLMPGYFIYDLGDMIRTFVSPVDEEEKEVSKIFVRGNIYDAVIQGYLSQMNEKLTEEEKKATSFSGLMMTYIMALRFLADFLNGNIYYITRYEEQNLVRASNQLKLLEELQKMK
jgi:thiamine kinase-like enzyme